MCKFSQVLAQIKAKRYSYENMVVWSAKNVFSRVSRPKCPKEYISDNLKLGPKGDINWLYILSEGSESALRCLKWQQGPKY